MIEPNRIYSGDCIEVMKSWPENFVDTIITDPPYGLDFMGKDWDGDVPGVHFWTEMLRVCKPGAMLLSFGGTRTWHHLAMAIEKAGWEIRDCLMWLYGSGFPKSLDIAKNIDKKDGRLGWKSPNAGNYGGDGGGIGSRPGNEHRTESFKVELEADLAREWSGWGTALKPAWEPIIVAMKPLDGTFAENAEKWKVAGINVDGGRISADMSEHIRGNALEKSDSEGYGSDKWQKKGIPHTQGRWPANLLLDEEAAGMLDGQSGISCHTGTNTGGLGKNGIYSSSAGLDQSRVGFGDRGGASRFFYVAKASRSERNAGCEELEIKPKPTLNKYARNSEGRTAPKNGSPAANHHPTVKPLSLMKYLCNLTRTPTGGIVLDPFAGSGSTLVAAEFSQRPWIGIEMNPEYVAIAQARLAREQAQMKMAI